MKIQFHKMSQKGKINEKDHQISPNVNNLEHETQQSPKTNKRESLQSTDKENGDLIEANEEGNVVGSDEKDNSVNPQQKEITSSDDAITSSVGTVLIQKAESLKTLADKVILDLSVDIQKKSVTSKISELHSPDLL